MVQFLHLFGYKPIADFTLTEVPDFDAAIFARFLSINRLQFHVLCFVDTKVKSAIGL